MNAGDLKLLTDEEPVCGFHETGSCERLTELTRRHVDRTRSLIYHVVLNDADAIRPST